MKLSRFAPLAAVLAAALMVSACANTIKGAGRDAANTVDATKNAGTNIGNAVE